MSPSFLHELARPQPDPGGGAAAAFGARVALALMEKVVRLEYQRPRNTEESGAFWEKTWQEVQEIARNLADLQDRDVRAYFQLTRARAANDAAALAMAVRQAVRCPGEIMAQAQQGLEMLISVGNKCRLHLISDLQVACELLGGALLGAYHIARANLPFLQDDRERLKEGERLDKWRDAALAARDRARSELRNRVEKR
jgi:formiminotetrahydrofolate cyclodeaminase